MGAFYSCPIAKHIGEKNHVKSQSLTVKSFTFGDDGVKPPEQSISFNNGAEETTVTKSVGSGRTALEPSVSFKDRDLEKIASMEATDIPLQEDELHVVANISPKSKDMKNQYPKGESSDGTQISMDPSEHMAATELQKVYRSFRTRRRLADCAVLAEKNWWKLLSFAELKRSSVSFFDIEKNQTAVSRWSRARTRVARVGKGLSKNEKAQMLALQHWLEAIDPRHRYGQNLQLYYDKWLHCHSKEPFFYWLDIGEGKEIDLVEECSRVKLQQQCIKYLGPLERTGYEVIVEEGKLVYKQSGELVHTTGADKHEKWIFVLSTSKTLYVGKKMKGVFHHSSFLAGGATLAAGRLAVENGILQTVWPHSGHYRPTEENFQEFINFLSENSIDLANVKMNPADEENNILEMQKIISPVRFKSSEEDRVQQLSAGLDDGTVEIVSEEMTSENSDFPKQEILPTIEPFELNGPINLHSKLTNIHIQDRSNVIDKLEIRSGKPREEENESCEVEIIPDDSIMKRINSHKETKSYQLGRQLSCKWTTGAGPRIGCVRDYPLELQLRALEQVCL